MTKTRICRGHRRAYVTEVGLASVFVVMGLPLQAIWFAVVCGAVVMFFCDLFFYRQGAWKMKKLDLGGAIALEGQASPEGL